MSKIIQTLIPSIHGNLSTRIHQSDTQTNKLAVLCPGYLDSKDYFHLQRLAEDLCEVGYTVVRFDPTGTWESDGNITHYTTTQYFEDIKNILNHVLSTNSYSEILLGGHSRGGQIAILYSARDPRITKVIGIMASYGSPEGKRRENWQKTGCELSRRDIPHDRNKTKEFLVPFSHVLDQDKFDALKDIAKIKVPIILIAGEKDDVVPPTDVLELYESADEPKKFILIKGIGHDYRFNPDEINFVNKEILEALELIK